MSLFQNRGSAERRVTLIRTSLIQPNPAQPRKIFEKKALQELSESIQIYGVLNPLTVRKTGAAYELIAGERRLRAAQMAGLREVPCLVIEADGRMSSLIALVENLQRADLGFFEEAEGYRRLIDAYGLTQEEAARRVGKSQSAVANKLRLLRFDEEEMERIRLSGLTERHARALLRLEDKKQRLSALNTVIRRGLTVNQTEEYVEAVLTPTPEKKNHGVTLRSFKDVRFFLNSVNRAVDLVRRSGLPAQCDRSEDEGGMTIVIRIPRPEGPVGEGAEGMRLAR